jgi:parallel beta-helix repeat protein
MTFDGGLQVSVSRTGGVINVLGNPAQLVNDVNISNIRITGMVSGKGGVPDYLFHKDGLDLNCINKLTVKNCVTDLCGDGIVVENCSSATVSNCYASSCKFFGVQIGDREGQSGSLVDVTISDCHSYRCGHGMGSTGAGFGVVTAPGGSIRRVRISNCESKDEGGNVQAYGLSLENAGTPPNGTISDVTVTGGRLQGYAAYFRSSAGMGAIGNISFSDVDKT